MGKSRYIWLIIFGMGAIVARAQVSQTELPDLTVGTIGDETDKPTDIWGENPKAEEVIRQINECASINFNDEERKILKKILMADVGGIKSLEERSEDYLRARLSTLIAQGMFREVITLLDKIPEKQQTNDMKQRRAEALFAEGFVQAACEENLMTAFENEEGFIRAICADSVGVPPKSALAYEVYRESGRDTHPFLNAAGEVLYRNLTPTLPEGVPSIWEMPVVVKAYGTDVFKRPLSRELLLTLINNEMVSHEIRRMARNRLDKPQESEKADGHILDYLSAWAKVRPQIQKILSQAPEKNRVESD